MLLDLLKEVLGSGRKTTGTNYIFFCPICRHHKPKLEIDPESRKWHCWVCSRGGVSINSLLTFIRASKEIYEKFRPYMRRPVRSRQIVSTVPATSQIVLPSEFIPLWVDDQNNWFWRAAMNYLLNERRIRYVDIVKYRLGYCISGRYKNRIIFPNFNTRGELNYFTARLFLDTSNCTFLLPIVPRDQIIGMEFFIDWSEPVIIVESILNAITVRRNACPLYGKEMSHTLKNKLIEQRTPEVIMALDKDAIVQSIDIISFLLGNGIKVKFVDFIDDRDVNDIGYDDIWKMIDNAQYVTNTDIFKIKSALLLNNKKIYFKKNKKILVKI